MFNLPFLPPPPSTVTYVCTVFGNVCVLWIFCLYLPILFLWFSPPPFEIQFHTHPHAHMRAVCGYNFSIIVEFLLIFFFAFVFFSFSHRSPLIFCGVCGCLPRQRLECNLCSLAKCWAFLLVLLPQTVLRFLLLGFRFMLIRIYCHLSFAWFTLIATSKPDQAKPSHAKPSV